MRQKASGPQQGDLFKVFLRDLVDPAHPLVRLAGQVDWHQFEVALAPAFADEEGRPSTVVRLAVGLMYLKYAYDLSDEDVVAAWTENPYWQFFTGGTFFEHRPPIDPSSLTNWRNRIGAAGAEQMLAATLRAGLKTKMIRPQDLKRVNVDTTVQEKEIRFPTDARLYHRSLEVLVRLAKRHDVRLRQTYVRVAKRSMLKLGGYAKAKQFKRAKRETKFLRTRLGRVLRDFQGKAPAAVLQECQGLLDRIERIRVQQRHDKRKVYSVHAPEVECIAKGKVHKQYEFGVKVGLVSTSKGNWIVGAKAFPGIRTTGTRCRKRSPRPNASWAPAPPWPVAIWAIGNPATKDPATSKSSIGSGNACPAPCRNGGNAAAPSSRSSATSNPTAEATATGSRAPPATRSTPSWPRRPTTSGSC